MVLTWETVCGQRIHLTETVRHFVRGWHIPRDGAEVKHEEQADAVLRQDHAQKKTYYRDHQRHA